MWVRVRAGEEGGERKAIYDIFCAPTPKIDSYLANLHLSWRCTVNGPLK